MTVVQAWSRCCGVALLGLITIGASAQDLPRYRCERLQGADLNGQNAFATAINVHGEVAGLGFFARRANVLTAARWKSDGSIEYLVRSARRHSGAYGINDAGDVAGYVMLNDGATHPAVRVNGVSTLLPSLPTDGRSGGNAASINNRGQVVGYSHVGLAIQLRATLWDQGRVIDLGALNDQLSSAATAINDRGVVVGSSDRRSGQPRAVRWVDGVIHDLGTLPGGTRSQASGISLDGLVVGSSNSAAHPYDLRATAWRQGEAVDLGALPGDSVSQAFGVSPDGAVIVGESRPEDGDTASAVAWFGAGGEPVVLDTLVVDGGCRDDKGNPRSLSTASGVNAHGDIAVTSDNYGPHGGLQVTAFRLKKL